MAEISVILNAKTAKFGAGMKRAVGVMNRFGAAAKRVQSALTGTVAKLAALAGIGGLGLVVKRTLSSIDSLTKMSDRLGITTKSLNRFKLAAELSGLSLQDLEKGFGKLQRNISDANIGKGGKVKKIFNLLGLDETRLKLQSTKDQMLSFVVALQAVENQADRLGFGRQILGKAADKFLNLPKTIDGFKELFRVADKAGVAFDRFSGKKVEDANDAITRLNALFKGMANTLTIQLAPAIETVANAWFAVGTQANWLENNALRPFDLINQAILTIGVTLDTLPVKFLKLVNRLTAFEIGVLRVQIAANEEFRTESSNGKRQMGKACENRTLRNWTDYIP